MTEFIVRVHRPELTEEERAKRMKLIREAAKELLIATELARKESKK